MKTFTERSSEALHVIGQWAVLAMCQDLTHRDQPSFEAYFSERGYSRAVIDRAWLEYTALRIRLRIRP